MPEKRRKLIVFDRSTIKVCLRDSWGARAIARDLKRAPGMISDEIKRHGGATSYRAQVAAAHADTDRRLTGHRLRLVQNGPLFGRVAGLLRLGWSPKQISGWCKRMEAGREQPPGLRVSHETIYALPRGELRRGLIPYLRQDERMRGRKSKGSERRGKLCDITNIKNRPKEKAGGMGVPFGT